jgi:integrase
MKERAKLTAPDDPVFAARTGKPIDEHNIARRHLKPVGKSLGMEWLSWHCFRRTHTTLANELGMAFTDRMAMMGHTEARMTALYTVDDLQRRRTVLDQMAARLVPASAPTKQKRPPRSTGRAAKSGGIVSADDHQPCTGPTVCHSRSLKP